MKRPKLKPCPFCGGEAKFQVSSPNWDGACNVRVKCSTEGCYANMLNGWQLNDETAAEKWNKRDTEEQLSKHLCTLLDIFNSLPDEVLKTIISREKLQEMQEHGIEEKNRVYYEHVIRPAENRDLEPDSGTSDST